MIRWACEACGELIRKGTGEIYIVGSELAIAEKALIERRREEATREPWKPINLEGYIDPPIAPWHARHNRCDPEPSASSYWFDVARARTALQILDWTFHLSEKSWYEATNWPTFIRSRIGVVDA